VAAAEKLKITASNYKTALMKFLWVFLITVASCKTSKISDDTRTGTIGDHKIEITFVNSDANYRMLMNAIEQVATVSEMQHYQVTSGMLQPLNVVSFSCYKVSSLTLVQFKNKISSCSGVVTIRDFILD
jgi:hypothetical protein